MNQVRGISLPETLISLFLASLILIALMQHYIHIKQHYHVLQTAADTSSQTLWAIDLIRNNIRQAGFTPCLSVNHLTTIDQRNGLEGLRALDTQDGLQINRMSSEFDEVVELANANQLLATNTHTLRLGEPLIIADCYHAEVFAARGVRVFSGRQLITLDHPLVFTYQSPVYIGDWIESKFYIRSERLMYHYRHTDELTSRVKTLSVHLTGSLLELILGLVDGRTLTTDTRIRAI